MEFKFRLKDEEMIYQMQEILGDENVTNFKFIFTPRNILNIKEEIKKSIKISMKSIKLNCR